MNIGLRIRELRLSQGITVTELAEKIQISQPYLSQIERGDRQAPIDVIGNICQVFKISLSQFFADEQTQLPPDILQLIEAAKQLTPLERKYLNMFLQLSLERKSRDSE
ncbi:helix-turn-helix domain-containing protein [Numidum massiliense]|uniref:helix-turn-helix domain-containing protein n=1 Tax=Numidum massiliense TaxID=1522315 RepID=UPI0006D53574|nr:helix-turn-helix transcriptional regulator [Numidum massiliense]